MAISFFIAGTDTGIGKTHATIALMEEYKSQGYKVAGMKPIASGAEKKNGVLINEDAEQIMESCSQPTPYELINPYVFDLPVSPHIAAEKAGLAVDLEEIKSSYIQLTENNDVVIVEGVGGWCVPISDDSTMVDLVKKLNLPVILTVGYKLGCINHAILTAERIKADGYKLLGWLRNQLDSDYLCINETQETLENAIASPCLGKLGFNDGSGGQNQFYLDKLSLNSSSL